MQQLSKGKSIVNHLYPGIIITIGFIILTPILLKGGHPPQLSLLLCVILIALPLLLGHLFGAKNKEEVKSIWTLNGYTNKLPTGRLILYALGLVVFAFLIWGITQPLNKIITGTLFSWLPSWYTVQDFSDYNKDTILLTLLLNVILHPSLRNFILEAIC